MKISLNWLKNYLQIDHSAERIAEILTDIGLEVEGVETFESIKGGLNGVLIGEIREVEQHPNADRLKLTKVDVGHADLLSIVCGAPNVAVGQKVPVALVGATLYPDENGFKIKKSKIRGELSEGMICAEDELGLGTDHDGIMVLDKSVKIGTAAADYFETKSDTVFEIGLTPNRIDAASHYGVARDLAAFLNMSEDIKLEHINTNGFKIDRNTTKVDLEIVDEDLCPRYSGLVIEELTVQESPDWLKNSLNAIGVKPINNVVDITNYVLHEIGQPLHAFDLGMLSGKKVIVKRASKGQAFTTLDDKERKLSSEDLMICNEKEPMCIAGVLGGAKSGVSEKTKAIFLESAYFNPVSIRKTAKRHALNTDASFRYERGADPNITVEALKMAAILMKEITGGVISSDLIDHYPKPIEDNVVTLHFKELDQLIGQSINKKIVGSILENLDFEILHEDKESLRLKVPSYRVDVTRPVDIIEEVLRIYGYNNIKLPSKISTNVSYQESISRHQLEEVIAGFLSSRAFTEILNNSLSNPDLYEDQADLIKMLNPLSKETEIMRKTMLYGGLQSIAYNVNRKHEQLKFYEFGKVYVSGTEGERIERNCLGIWLSGNDAGENWRETQRKVNLFDMKAVIEAILKRLGVDRCINEDFTEKEAHYFSAGLKVIKRDKQLAQWGKVSTAQLQKVDLSEDVFYAELDLDNIIELIANQRVQYQGVSKFPSVRRDLALLIDEDIRFEQIEKHAQQIDKKLLKSINLFDVYEGKNLPKGKKSYGVSFVFQDSKKTLTDQHVDRIMQKLIKTYEQELKAELR